VVAVDHQHTQRLSVAVRAHLGRVRTGQELLRRPDGVDRVTLTRPTLADMAAAVDLDHSLALVDQEPGQPRPVVAGSFDRPYHRDVARGRAGPRCHLRIPGLSGLHSTLSQRPAADVAQRSRVGVDVRVHSDHELQLINDFLDGYVGADAEAAATSSKLFPAAAKASVTVRG